MWTLLPSERLRSWHDFRKEINDLDLTSAIEKTNHLWCYAPFVNHYLTTDQIADWPDPWELLYENYYCDLAKALGMLYTLYLSDHKDNLTMEIRIYTNPDTKQTYNLVWINQGKYVLNLEYDEVVNKHYIDQRLKLKETISIEQLKLQTL